MNETNKSKNEPNPLVSVVLPFYNREKVLPRAVTSVLRQSYQNIELILVDDCSTDLSCDVARSFEDERIRVFSTETNAGAGGARNKGLSEVRGEYIAFQDSDDEWLPSKIEAQVNFLNNAPPSVGAVFGGKLLVYEDKQNGSIDGSVKYVPASMHKSKLSVEDMLIKGNVISPQTLMIRSSVVEATGLFDARLKNNEDWDFMLRLSGACKIHYMEMPVVVAYLQANSITKDTQATTVSLELIANKFKDTLSKDPKAFAKILRRVGSGYYDNEDYMQALKYHKAAVGLDPTQPKSWIRLLGSTLAGTLTRLKILR